MKLLILCEDTYSGGIDTFISTLVNEWPSRSDEISLLFNEDHPGVPVVVSRLERPCVVRTQRVWSNHRLHLALEGHRILRAIKRACTPALKYCFFVWHVFSLRRLLLAGAPDRLLVVNGGYPGTDVCRAAVVSWALFSPKPRAVLTIHNQALPIRWFERPQEWIVDYCVGRASGAIVVVSNASAEALSSRRGMLTRHQRPITVYYGISRPTTPGPAGPSLREELGIPAASMLCLTLATYEPRKGHAFLFRAFERVWRRFPDAHLVLCGYGPADEVQAVRALAEASPARGHIHLFGFRSDVDRLLSAADLLLVSSQEYEGLPQVCIEAFRFRLPVVATNVGGLPEALVQGGVVVDAADADGFATAAIALLESEDLRRQTGNDGYRRYEEHFTGARMAQDYAALLQ